MSSCNAIEISYELRPCFVNGKKALFHKWGTRADVRHMVQATWKWELADNGWANHICSECGWKKNTDIHVGIDYKYCPNCGAKMDLE